MISVLLTSDYKDCGYDIFVILQKQYDSLYELKHTSFMYTIELVLIDSKSTYSKFIYKNSFTNKDQDKGSINKDKDNSFKTETIFYNTTSNINMSSFKYIQRFSYPEESFHVHGFIYNRI